MADPLRIHGLRRSFVGATAAALATVLLAACAPATAPSSTSSPPTSPPPSTFERPAAPEGELSTELQAELQATLDATMAEYDVTGAAVGVWVPGEGSWTTAAGIADIDTGAAASVSMQWPLRSVTKSYTVTLILQLVDEGVLSLDDTIGEYVDGVTDGDRVTLRELANMSSGVAEYTNDAFIASFVPDPTRLYTLEELNGFALGLPAQFEPGARKVYTNTNTNLLGAVVEKVTGEDFGTVLEERILEPVGQSGSRYVLDASTWTDPHAVGYRLEDGVQEPQPDNLSIYGPAGSMISSLDDARVWAEVLATGSLLSPDTQAEREEGAPLEKGPPYDIYAFGLGQTNGWWGHNGEGFGFTAAVFHDPASGASIAVFTNASDTATKAHPADQLFRRFADVLENGSGS